MSGISDYVTSLVPRATGYVTSLVPTATADAWRSGGGGSGSYFCGHYVSWCPRDQGMGLFHWNGPSAVLVGCCSGG